MHVVAEYMLPKGYCEGTQIHRLALHVINHCFKCLTSNEWFGFFLMLTGGKVRVHSCNRKILVEDECDCNAVQHF